MEYFRTIKCNYPALATRADSLSPWINELNSIEDEFTAIVNSIALNTEWTTPAGYYWMDLFVNTYKNTGDCSLILSNIRDYLVTVVNNYIEAEEHPIQLIDNVEVDPLSSYNLEQEVIAQREAEAQAAAEAQAKEEATAAAEAEAKKLAEQEAYFAALEYSHLGGRIFKIILVSRSVKK